jgi:hypothetical protein
MRTLLTVTALLLATSARADGPPVWDGSSVTPVIIQLVAAPVVIQDQPPVVEGRAPDRIAELERRVAALEGEVARYGHRSPQPGTMPGTMPVPAGYQQLQLQQPQVQLQLQPSLGIADAGACASGDCGAGGRSYRVAPFGGRFRRR